MNRRNFLKTMLAGAAAAQFPGLLVAKTNPEVAEIGYYESFRFIESDLSQFANDQRFGNMLATGKGEKSRMGALRILKDDVIKHLKPGTRYELLGGTPTDYGHKYTYAWYADREIQSKPVTGLLSKPVLQKDRGTYLLGRGIV